jgi:hypothetical protein
MRVLRLLLTVSLLAFAAGRAFAGWSFDTAGTPEAARELFVTPGAPHAPVGSWLRIREMEVSAVYGESGRESPIATGIRPPVSIAERRAALAALRDQGFRLVATVGWPVSSWPGGVRPDQPLRRLPLDLREAAERCFRLGATYGDLIDYWEIQGEQDISFVEENPETYAAFMKACWLGFRRATTAGPQRNGVLNGAFALPPGPYFNAWVANDGLRYIDGFNYHFYGYAEDLTGVYRQFEAAVTQSQTVTPSQESVFVTRFYPHGPSWQPAEVFSFSAGEEEISGAQNWLQARPLGTHEPPLGKQGRWLVSPGTSVRETPAGWEFTVTQPAPGPMRPAMAELPLRAGWKIQADAHLAFQYRITKPTSLAAENLPPPVPVSTSARPVVSYPTASPRSATTNPGTADPAVSRRLLPVFLTEYGYGLLSGDARNTAPGRASQREWFETAERQVRTLGITALAFNLRPNYNARLGEFGLLMNPESAPPGVFDPITTATPPSKFTGYSISPALAFLLEAGTRSIESMPWDVAAFEPTPVVIDFVAGTAVVMNKSGCGYQLQAKQAAGECILYNFDSHAVNGELTLTGPWRFPGNNRTLGLVLQPGERRRVRVVVEPASSGLYAAQVAAARFQVFPTTTSHPAEAPSTASTGSQPSEDTPAPAPPSSKDKPAPVADPGGVNFEAYLRTSNGNLYQTWPRVKARTEWQWYSKPLTNFTPAFFGRAHLPTALIENEPAALVFFFRVTEYPATFLIRRASVVEFHATDGNPAKGETQ